jgi:hypothetical protein
MARPIDAETSLTNQMPFSPAAGVGNVNSGGCMATKSEPTGKAAGTSASRLRRDGRPAKSGKTVAGSALSQRPVTKRASITEAQAAKAVGSYLSERKK